MDDTECVNEVNRHETLLLLLSYRRMNTQIPLQMQDRWLQFRSSKTLTTPVGTLVGKGVGASVGGHKLGSHSEFTSPPELHVPRF